MSNRQKITNQAAGFSLIEILVTIVILVIGLLGLVAMIGQSQRAEMESYQRAQALLLLQDMVSRINANRTNAGCYAVTNAASGAPYFGVGSSLTPTCSLGSVNAYTMAIQDMTTWNNLLIGSSESLSSTSVGAMPGARGCVSFDSATNIYLVSIAWQGIAPTSAPPAALTCATGLYGSELQRRVVSIPLVIANLN